MCKRKSMYEPYYYKIQELLYDGMSIKEAWIYMQVFFQMYADYNTFWHYVKVSGLKWFMPVRGKKK